MTASAPELGLLRARLSDRYTIGRQLGRGGMGAVYLARDVQLDRSVAVKVLPPECAAQSDLRERFLRETRTAASISHPNSVPVLPWRIAATCSRWRWATSKGRVWPNASNAPDHSA